MRVFRVLISFHDFFFYATREYGSRAVTGEFIHNYALMYALNNFTRFISKTKPHYLEDIPNFEIYATPARPYHGTTYLRSAKIDWSWNDPVWISYNALSSALLFSMKKEQKKKLVLPLFGSYLKYPPLNTFEFFVLANRQIPRVVRVGKKLPPGRIKLFECKIIAKSTGKFEASHIVNPRDIKDTHKVLDGTLITTPPTPLLLDARLDGPYIYCEYKNEYGNPKKVYIAIPDPKLYRAILSG